MTRRAVAGLIAGAIALTAASVQAERVAGYPGVDVFAMPRIAENEVRADALVRAGRYVEAERLLDGLLVQYPDVARWQAMRAAVAAGLGDEALALEALERAASLGFRDMFGALSRPPLSRLANHPRVVALTAKSPPEPAAALPPRARVVSRGAANVEAENTGWDPERRRLTAFFAFPRSLRRLPLYPRPPEAALAGLDAMVRSGRAAGNAGDLYDNRDGGHSMLRRDPKVPTQLSHVVYGDAARRARVHYGLNDGLHFNSIVFGNSSTALQGPNWRSQPRLAMTTPRGAERLWRLYEDNHLYVYPANKDFVSEKDGWRGDVFPAYVPYVIASRGKSGSDRPFLRAIQAILAALPPKTKSFLKERRLIAPTVQQILRRSLRSALGRNGYLSASAHRTAFDGADIDLATAIANAQAMTPGVAPPLVKIGMLEEPKLRSGVSFFANGMTEALFDTPAAIARVWRGVEPSRKYVLQATAADPNGRPVTFHWRVLRGAPDAVRITPRSADGAKVSVTVAWQDRQPDLHHPDVLSHRVDVAAFADNGAQLSAPAIFSVAFPSHQTRTYEQGPRGYRIASVDYMRGPSRYADPAIWPIRHWRDEYRYDAKGAPLGWTRIRHGGKRTEFRADGRRADGTRVVYALERRPKEPRKPHLFVVETAVGR